MKTTPVFPTTTEPDPRGEQVRMLGAQAHEVVSGRRAVKRETSGHDVSLSLPFVVDAPGEVSEANGADLRGSKSKKPKTSPEPVEENRAALAKTKLRSIVLFTDEITEQARALGAVDPDKCEEVLSIVGALRDVAEGRDVIEPTVRELMKEKKALARALDNMREAHKRAADARDDLIARDEQQRARIEDLETERESLRVILTPLPGESLHQRATDLVVSRTKARNLLKKYEAQEAQKVKAIDATADAQPAAEDFDPGMYEGTGAGVRT